MNRIGPVMQIAYVVEDIDSAVAHWNKLGVGPFFITRHPKYAQQTYRGTPTDCDISAAFAFTGELQIELVQQHNDAPSPFKEYVDAQGFGMQHMGVLTEDLEADTATLTSQGFAPFHRMISAIGVETVFFNSDQAGGTVLELIKQTPEVQAGFSYMKSQARTWNGEPASIEF